MSIKPLDMQTSINQMHEVGRQEHGKNEALLQEQHLLQKQSNDKSVLTNSRLDEAKKGEGTAIKDEGGKNPKKKYTLSKEEKEKKDTETGEILTDERMGKFIDVLK